MFLLKYSVEQFKKDLQNQSWTQSKREDKVNSGWNNFKILLKAVIDKHAPLKKKKIRMRDCPWLTNEIRKKINERDSWSKRARTTGKGNDWSMYRRLRILVTRSIRHSKVVYSERNLQEHTDHPKQFCEK